MIHDYIYSDFRTPDAGLIAFAEFYNKYPDLKWEVEFRSKIWIVFSLR